VIGEKWIASTSTTPSLYDRPSIYDMTLVFDHSERQIEKVGTLKSFLIICLELMKNEFSLSMNYGKINHCTQEKYILIAHRAIHEVHHKKIMKREL
jgi:hypothetical protein